MTPIDAIQSDLARFLEGLGFRSRERAFNRPTDDGLTQVVELELARVDASRRRPIPGLDESHTGSFSVSLGVLVPEIFRRDFDRERPEFSYAKDCAIRVDLGALGPEKRELWWLVALHDEVSKEVVQRLDRDGLPFLERLESREAIVARWRDDPSLRRDGRAPYVVAGILVEQGRRDEARRVMEESVAGLRDLKTAESYSALSEKLGLGPIPF